MLTFDSAIKKLAEEELLTAGIHLRQPEQPVRELLFHPASLHQMQDGCICILYVSEFNRLNAKPPGLYCLISDHAREQRCQPDVDNWALFPHTVTDSRLYRCLHHWLTVSRRVNASTLRLIQSLLRKDSLAEIVAIGEQELGNPVFLSDTSTKVLLFSNPDVLADADDELIQSVINYGFVTAELFDKYDYNTLLDIIGKSQGAFLTHSRFARKHDRIIVKLTVNGDYFGWVVAFPSLRPFVDGDCEIMDVLAGIITVELEKQKGDFTYGHREGLLMELMSNQIVSSDEFWTRANYLGWNKSKQYHVVVVGFQQQRQQSSREQSQTALAYKNHLGLIFPSIPILSIRDQLVLLLEAEHLSPTLHPLRRFLSNYSLSAAVSDGFHDILDFRDRYQQAADILQLGARLTPERSLFFYEELYLYHYISQLAKHGDPQDYYLPGFRTLLDYDRQHHTAYIQTLRVYLDYRNVMETAAALHIHRNTMNYRLQNIQEIAGLDLTRGDTLYKLWFSFILHDVVANNDAPLPGAP